MANILNENLLKAVCYIREIYEPPMHARPQIDNEASNKLYRQSSKQANNSIWTNALQIVQPLIIMHCIK